MKRVSVLERERERERHARTLLLSPLASFETHGRRRAIQVVSPIALWCITRRDARIDGSSGFVDSHWRWGRDIANGVDLAIERQPDQLIGILLEGLVDAEAAVATVVAVVAVHGGVKKKKKKEKKKSERDREICRRLWVFVSFLRILFFLWDGRSFGARFMVTKEHACVCVCLCF